MHCMRGVVGRVPSSCGSSMQGWHQRAARPLPLVHGGALSQQRPKRCLASMQTGELPQALLRMPFLMSHASVSAVDLCCTWHLLRMTGHDHTASREDHHEEKLAAQLFGSKC